MNFKSILKDDNFTLKYYNHGVIGGKSDMTYAHLNFCDHNDNVRCSLDQGSLRFYDSSCNPITELIGSDGNIYLPNISLLGGVGDIIAKRDIAAQGTVSAGGVALTSDAKLKEDIVDLDNQKSLELINSLKPVEYVFKNNNNHRKHMGFIAQSTKEIFDSLGWGNMSIYEAKVSDEIEETYYSEDIDDQYLRWTLKYSEFIAPMVCAIQELTKEIETLQTEINRLKGEK